MNKSSLFKKISASALSALFIWSSTVPAMAIGAAEGSEPVRESGAAPEAFKAPDQIAQPAQLDQLNFPAETAGLESSAVLKDAVTAASQGQLGPVPSGAVGDSPAAAARTKTGLPRYPGQSEVHAPARNSGSLLGRIQNFVSNKLSALNLYDGAAMPSTALGIRAAEPLKLPKGVKELDRKPRPPQSGPGLMAAASVYHLPGIQSSASAGAEDSRPIALQANINDLHAIDAEIRKHVDDNPQNYKIPSSELLTLHVQEMKPVDGDKARRIIALYRQVRSGADAKGDYRSVVAGGYLKVTIMEIDGKLQIRNRSWQLLPQSVKVAMTPKFNDSVLRDRAHERMRPSFRANTRGYLAFQLRRTILGGLSALGLAQDNAPIFMERDLIHSEEDGQWHTANLYYDPDSGATVAVDVATGQTVCAWDGRKAVHNHISAAAAEAGHSQVVGIGNTDPGGNDNGPVGEMPLGELNGLGKDGKVLATSDLAGLFDLAALKRKAAAEGPQQVTFSLDQGVFARVHNADKKMPPFKVTVTVAPGEAAKVVFDTQNKEELRALVNDFVYANQHHHWIKNEGGINDSRVDAILNIYANLKDTCNAYYDPRTDSYYTFQAGGGCENTAQESIALHEQTHRVVQKIAGLRAEGDPTLRYAGRSLMELMAGGPNEGISDIVSMLKRNNPFLAQGFFTAPPPGQSSIPPYLRSGSDMDGQYQGEDQEVHDIGLAFGQTAWHSYVDMGPIVGQAVSLAYATTLIVPTTIFGQPQSLPDAIHDILLALTKKSGDLSLEVVAIVRKNAAAHSIPLQGDSAELTQAYADATALVAQFGPEAVRKGGVEIDASGRPVRINIVQTAGWAWSKAGSLKTTALPSEKSGVPVVFQAAKGAKEMALAQARAAKEKLTNQLIQWDPSAQASVTGVGIAAGADGWVSGVAVRLQKPLPAGYDIPETIDGVPVDVQITGTIRK